MGKTTSSFSFFFPLLTLGVGTSPLPTPGPIVVVVVALSPSPSHYISQFELISAQNLEIWRVRNLNSGKKMLGKSSVYLAFPKKSWHS
jgi:hypothetical protein